MQPVAGTARSEKKRALEVARRTCRSRTQEGRFLFVHGSPRDPVREYVLSTDGFLNPEKLRAIFDSFEGVAVGGHTHHPGMHDESLRFQGLDGADTLSSTLEVPPEGKYFINVGSVGQPRDSDNARLLRHPRGRPQITWHRVDLRPHDDACTRSSRRRMPLNDLLGRRRLPIGK